MLSHWRCAVLHLYPSQHDGATESRISCIFPNTNGYMVCNCCCRMLLPLGPPRGSLLSRGLIVSDILIYQWSISYKSIGLKIWQCHMMLSMEIEIPAPSALDKFCIIPLSFTFAWEPSLDEPFLETESLLFHCLILKQCSYLFAACALYSK